MSAATGYRHVRQGTTAQGRQHADALRPVRRANTGGSAGGVSAVVLRQGFSPGGAGGVAGPGAADQKRGSGEPGAAIAALRMELQRRRQRNSGGASPRATAAV